MWTQFTLLCCCGAYKRTVKYLPTIISILTIIAFLLVTFLGQTGLPEMICYGIANLFFYYGIYLTYVFKNGRLIDQEGIGKYIFRPSKFQPIGFSRLSTNDKKTLADKYPRIQINNKIINQCKLLMIVHPTIAIFTIWTWKMKYAPQHQINASWL